MANAAAIEIARTVRQTIATSALTESQAKLYSQRLRRDMGREGLASFSRDDVYRHLDEAALLIQCGLLERDNSQNSDWRRSVKRAAEILEWLSQPDIQPADAPLRLLSAAAYQIANYPAMALGQLRQAQDDDSSRILREFLRADFPESVSAIRDYLSDTFIGNENAAEENFGLTEITYHHIVMCISTVCSFLRTGSVPTDRALAKVEKLGQSLVDSRDPYSYLLAQLTAAICRRYVDSSLWRQVNRLAENSSQSVSDALDLFARSAFVNRRSLVWPAQATGIDRLVNNDSFVLCTPTGSGKTTVATLAIVQNLFAANLHENLDLGANGPANMILYIVPTRALAAEVESRLSQDLRGLSIDPVVITGLYGGVDWGPTDAWLGTESPTIVICTFEKADALIRYLGVLFLHRIRLVIIDEAHEVEQDKDRVGELSDGSSRAFRLEQLGVRLFRARSNYGFRVLGLSAVAARAAPALARWIAEAHDAHPTASSYRSTRQMLGRLEVSAAGQFAIRYNLMDGCSLKFQEGGVAETPFVPGAVPDLPGGLDAELGVEVQMRIPCLWAAMQLAAERNDGSKPSVLISITQGIQNFATTCADWIDDWADDDLPNYRSDHADDLVWSQCVATVEDYFGTESAEYRLLQRGIAVHHGKMPGLLARRLKKVIDSGHARIVVATSTLSQGVNIPVNYLLMPSICRGPGPLSVQEFSNVIGRAGRAGVATEGSALVVLPVRTRVRDAAGRIRFRRSRQWDGYNRLVRELEESTAAASIGAPEDRASSPISRLLTALHSAWEGLVVDGTHEEFVAWLEQTAVVDRPDDADIAYDFLESLDSFLIASIQEIEELRDGEIPPQQLENELAAIWQQTYAFASLRDEARLGEILVTRGRATKAIYPDAVQRRKIYKSSLRPRSAITLMNLTGEALERIENGAAYAAWDTEEKFEFIRDILAMLAEVPAFKIESQLGRRKNFTDWPALLHWWLSKETAPTQPEPSQVSTWYYFVAQNFVYRGAWGIGSLIGLLFDSDEENEPIRALEISDWPKSGLPWIAFWIKELITWGTLDPVAAYLLARNKAVDRSSAETDAVAYYQGVPEDLEVEDILDPRKIRDWANTEYEQQQIPPQVAELDIDAVLERPAEDYLSERLKVIPLEIDGNLVWIDPAGYVVARSERPGGWPEDTMTFDFDLVVSAAAIVGRPYLRQT